MLKSHIEWSLLITGDQQLQHLPQATVQSILEQLEGEMKFKLHEAGNDIILLKETVSASTTPTDAT